MERMGTKERLRPWATALALAMCVGLLSASAQRGKPSEQSLLQALKSSYTLPVTYVEQPESSNWCWAAVGETIMGYHGHDVSSERQVKDYSASTKITKGPSVGNNTNNSSKIGGWPQFQDYGFHAKHTSKPLSYRDIVREIFLHQRPIAYAYSPKGRMGHIVSVIGFSRTRNGTPYLICYDSQIQGRKIRIPYSDYAKAFGYHKHLRTYHQVYPKK